ncbi:MAG TPA: TerB family tellurite resistance protein [Gemmatimonadales bacterium]
MLDALRTFFKDKMAPLEADAAVPADPARGPAHDPVHVAACALLLELAHADNEFTQDEREHIEEALHRHFGLDDATARELIALAERAREASVDLYQFTSLINANYDEGQRMVLAELMWRIVYADGELAKHESYLMRRLSTLLELRPGYLAEAQRRAARPAEE